MRDSFTFDEYQETADKTAIYPATFVKNDAGEFVEVPLIYVSLGMAGEAGEVANKVKKILRDNHGIIPEELVEDLIDECGDVLWYLAQTLRELKSSLAYAGRKNNTKLLSRLKRNVLKGKGDKR